MITLCMDTSSKFLVLALIEEDRLIGKRCLSSWKRQSEMIFPQLTELLEECHLTPKAIKLWSPKDRAVIPACGSQ